MPLYPDYVTAAQLKFSLGIPAADVVDDALLAIVITAASRAVDAETGRQFGVAAAAVARISTWDGRHLEGRPAAEVFDFASTTGLAVVTLDDAGATESTLVNGTDFDLWPWEAAADGKPWTHLVLRPAAVGTFPGRARGVKVTALWGWTAVPKLVENAILLQAARWYKRKDAPFGVAETPSGGEGFRLLARLDADVALSLQSVRRVWGAV